MASTPFCFCWQAWGLCFCLEVLLRFLLSASIYAHPAHCLGQSRCLPPTSLCAVNWESCFLGNWGCYRGLFCCQSRFTARSANICVRWGRFMGGSTGSVWFKFTGRRKTVFPAWPANGLVRFRSPFRKFPNHLSVSDVAGVLTPVLKNVCIFRNKL